MKNNLKERVYGFVRKYFQICSKSIKGDRKANPFDYFDKIYCINLDSRPDRWEQVQKEFEKVGIETRVTRISAVTKKEVPYDPRPRKGKSDLLGAFACSLSHFKCLQDVMENNYSNYLVFEDDVCFKDYNSESFSTALNELPDDWNVFLLGCDDWNCSKKKNVSDHIEKRNGFGCTHAIAINSNLYEKFEKEFNKRVIDENTRRKRWWKRTDYFYTAISKNLFALKNPIAFQSDSDSNIR